MLAAGGTRTAARGFVIAFRSPFHQTAHTKGMIATAQQTKLLRFVVSPLTSLQVFQTYSASDDVLFRLVATSSTTHARDTGLAGGGSALKAAMYYYWWFLLVAKEFAVAELATFSLSTIAPPKKGTGNQLLGGLPGNSVGNIVGKRTMVPILALSLVQDKESTGGWHGSGLSGPAVASLFHVRHGEFKEEL